MLLFLLYAMTSEDVVVITLLPPVTFKQEHDGAVVDYFMRWHDDANK